MRHALSAALLLCFIAANATADVEKAAQAKDDKEQKSEAVRGEVKKVDADKGILVLSINGKDEEFRVPMDAKITVGVAKEIKDAEGGLKDLWFKSAAQAAGSGRFFVTLTKDKQGNTRKVHLKTPTGE